MFSDIALKIFCAVKKGIIRTNAQFWKEFASEGKILSLNLEVSNERLFLKENAWNLICCFDESFPKINNKLKNSEKPFLFAYKGNFDLLNSPNNIAVIGTTSLTAEISKRESTIIKELVNNGLNIVSGLAKGCDTIAHEECLKNEGNTIAFLPTTLNDISPKENKDLAEKIIKSGGLIITEYVTRPKNKYENIKRFIDRDRLQALFSKAVILIASNSQGNGDSGSRHAMDKANEYGKIQLVMFNEQDDNNPLFQMNQEYINLGAKVLTKQIIKELKSETSN